MRRVTALLAAALAVGTAALAVAGCGEDGAEPGAPEGASIVLDFTPNAAHSGLYAAKAQGFYQDAGLELEIRQPGASTDGPALLEAGKADFAVMDIHDLGLAREAGLDLVGVMPIVQRPLGSVIARADRGIVSPADLQGRRVGVTGLPSDDAILESAVRAAGGDRAAVNRVTIGFNAVADLAAGNVDAATAFWNVEGVTLRRRGVPVRVFRVDDFGAPPYPELVLATSRATLEEEPQLIDRVIGATSRGYAIAFTNPGAAVDALLQSVPSLPRADLEAQMKVLRAALRPKPFDRGILEAWAEWDVRNGILRTRPEVAETFSLP